MFLLTTMNKFVFCAYPQGAVSGSLVTGLGSKIWQYMYYKRLLDSFKTFKQVSIQAVGSILRSGYWLDIYFLNCPFMFS